MSIFSKIVKIHKNVGQAFADIIVLGIVVDMTAA